MPIVNSAGRVICEQDPNDPVVRLARQLSVLKYPKDVDKIAHLSYQHFSLWLYGLDPKEALYLTNTPEFRKIQEAMRGKSWFTNFCDRVWRGWNGIDF